MAAKAYYVSDWVSGSTPWVWDSRGPGVYLHARAYVADHQTITSAASRGS